MQHRKLVFRSLLYHWRIQLGAVLGVGLAAAVLIGALVVGDSVRQTLRDMALLRLGQVRTAVVLQERFFDDTLADRLPQPDADAGHVAALLMTNGSATVDSGQRVNNVQVVGVDDRVWAMSPAGTPPADWPPREGLSINTHLADALQLGVGDELLLLLPRPSLLPRDAPLSTLDDSTVTQRMAIRGIVDDQHFGRFSLRNSQLPPHAVYLPRAELQSLLDMAGKANVLLASRDVADAALAEAVTLSDMRLHVQPAPGRDVVELRTPRVFLDDATTDAAKQAWPKSHRVLTYFVNRIERGEALTPYSMVTATGDTALTGPIADDDIVLTDWAADDLGANVGDAVTLRYVVISDARELETRSRDFTVTRIIPLEGGAVDPTLMPDFPGMSEAEDCREWDAGFDIDYDLIRDKDEAYWDKYRGTPKAYIALPVAEKLWANRFGTHTAVRAPLDGATVETMRDRLRAQLDPAAVGIAWQPLRRQALAAASPPNDFGMLFLSFSFFLIVAALLLTGMLYVFGVEQRAAEVGTLLAVGWQPVQVRRLLMIEGLGIAVAGTLLGIIGGLGYTRLVLLGLETVWSDAAAGTTFDFHVKPASLAVGAVSTIGIALLVMWLMLRRQARRPARALLAEQLGGGASTARRPWLSFVVAGLCAFVVVGILAGGTEGNAQATALLFFSAGGALLVGALCLCHAALAMLSRGSASDTSAATLAMRNATRRRARSSVTIALLACGVFMVTSVGIFRHDPTQHAEQRSAGTGGFPLMVQLTTPVFRDLNNPDVRYDLGFNEQVIDDDVRFIPFRVRAGDEASCLNLNQAMQPRLLGVDSDALHELEAFIDRRHSPWHEIQQPLEPGVVPGIADEPTIMWALKTSVGGTVEYTDEQGRSFKVKLIAELPSSVLQGNVLIDADAFTQRFPSASGYQMYFVDGPWDRIDAMRSAIADALEDHGPTVTPTVQRLREYLAVEHAYIAIFQSLGALGVLLGSVGLGVVVLRNVLERRSELALLRSVGFTRATIRRLVLGEHAALLVAGVACGLGSALIAVLPALRGGHQQVELTPLLLTLLAITGSAVLWIVLATVAAVRGPLLDALRCE